MFFFKTWKRTVWNTLKICIYLFIRLELAVAHLCIPLRTPMPARVEVRFQLRWVSRRVGWKRFRPWHSLIFRFWSWYLILDPSMAPMVRSMARGGLKFLTDYSCQVRVLPTHWEIAVTTALHTITIVIIFLWNNILTRHSNNM